MKIEVNMKNEKELTVSMWWAKTPNFALNALRDQLSAAQVIWPELKSYSIRRRGKSVEIITQEQKDE